MRLQTYPNDWPHSCPNSDRFPGLSPFGYYEGEDGQRGLNAWFWGPSFEHKIASLKYSWYEATTAYNEYVMAQRRSLSSVVTWVPSCAHLAAFNHTFKTREGTHYFPLRREPKWNSLISMADVFVEDFCWRGST